MAVTNWLIDKSALVRLQLDHVSDAESWYARVDRRLVRTGAEGREGFLRPPLALMPIERVTPAIEDRAEEVQMLLADRGQHRAPSIPDLLIAVTAEKSGLTVLAVDEDFGLIADVTGQPVETLVLR